MRVRSLLPVVCLAVFAQFAAAAPPQLTYKAPVYDVTTTPGATIAWLHSIGLTVNGTGTLTDTDNDGKIAFDTGSPAWYADDTFVVVDLATGEYASSKRSVTPPEAHWVLPGPTGEFTELFYGRRSGTALWVRPGVGAWAPPAHFLEDDDESSTNGIVISSVRSFQPLGSSPATPAAFERGDVLFLHTPDWQILTGGVLEPLVKDPNYTGVITFMEPWGPSPTVEGNDIIFPVLRLFSTTGTVSARFRTYFSGGGTPGVDYTPVDTVVTFGPGEMVKRVPVPTINDPAWAPLRRVSANLQEPRNTVLFSDTIYHQVIVDDDPVPVVAIETPATFTETDAMASVTATITITGARRDPVTVRTGISPVPGPDQYLVFQPSETRKDVVFNVPGDDVPVGDRVFHISVLLTETDQRVNREVQRIEDDLNVLTIPPVTVQETVGKVALKPVSAPSMPPAAATFKWTTVDGSAKAGSDYVHASGTWKPNTTWEIQLVNDGAVEELETFYIDITDVTKLSAAATRIAVTIVDDDALPPPIWSDLRAEEGNGRTSRIMHATLSLPQALSYPVMYQVTSAPGTAKPGTDYDRSPVSVTLQAGQASARVEVSIFGDDYPEEDETFTLNVTGTTSSAVFTIVNDDSGRTPTLSAPGAVTVQESTGRDTAVRFVVSLDAPAAHMITMDFQTWPGTALQNIDYDFSRGTLFFLPGETSKNFTLGITADAITEPTEQFTLVLSEPTGVVMANSVVTVRILDDDSPTPPTPKPGRSRAVRH